MDLAKLQEAVEAAPGAIKRLAEAIERDQRAARGIQFFQEAVRLLRVSWKDSDPGKYTAHWYAFKGGRKAWPAELIDGAGERKPDPAKLCAFAELDRKPCPHCEAASLEVECYEQSEDGPSGDTWIKTRYLMCADCRGLYRLGAPLVSSYRF